MSGYTDCACRDCFEVAFGGLCTECATEGCEEWPGEVVAEAVAPFCNYECQREDAYQG